MKLELTKRDFFLFEQLCSYGLLSTNQIKRLTFSGIDESIALRRLRRLRTAGYLCAHSGLGRGLLVWTVAKKALDRICSDSGAITINRHTLEHDLLLSEIRMRMEKNGMGAHWKNSFFLKQKAAKSKSTHAKQIPDLLFAIQAVQKPKVVAVELENVQKSKRRYKAILENYASRPELHILWYIVPSRRLGEFLINEYTGDLVHSPKLYYSLLSDVIDEAKAIILRGAGGNLELSRPKRTGALGADQEEGRAAPSEPEILTLDSQ
ncbi:MAG: replication-relaxation family protein [Bacteriovoracia bacterium]